MLKVIPSGPQSHRLDRFAQEFSGALHENGWIELTLADCQELLRRFDQVCREEKATAILLAESTVPSAADAPYARMWDRTDSLAAELTAWREGRAAFPRLLAAEMVRLPV